MGLSENTIIMIVDTLSSFLPVKEPYAEENPCKSPTFRPRKYPILLLSTFPTKYSNTFQLWQSKAVDPYIYISLYYIPFIQKKESAPKVPMRSPDLRAHVARLSRHRWPMPGPRGALGWARLKRRRHRVQGRW